MRLIAINFFNQTAALNNNNNNYNYNGININDNDNKHNSNSNSHQVGVKVEDFWPTEYGNKLIGNRDK